MATNKKPENGESAGKPKKSKKKILLLLLIVLLIGGAGGGGWWYFKMRNNNGDAKKEVKVAAPVFMALEQFTVNLNPEGGEHYLQTSITLQVSNNDDIDQIKLYMPQVRSRILMLLTSKKAADIATTQGKQKLAEEIKAQVNMPVVPGAKALSVVNVFFTAFVIQ
jgi:flagellar FliL protein